MERYVKYDEGAADPTGRGLGLNGPCAITLAAYMGMALLSWSAIQEVGYSCPCPSVAMLQLVSLNVHVLLSTHTCARHHKKAQAIIPRSPQEHTAQELT